MARRMLVIAARECEDVANGLRSFRDALPDRNIVSIIAKLYEISSLLTKLDEASQHPQYGPSFHRITHDVLDVLRSCRASNQLVRDMFGRTRSMTYSRVWSDMDHQMRNVEGVSLHERLLIYRGFLGCCIAELRDEPSPQLDGYYEHLLDLLDSQQLGNERPRIDLTGVYRHVEAPLSPSTQSSDRPLPFAPDPPISPTWTNSTDNTFQSSQTSNSALGAQPTHWARAVFDCSYPSTHFRHGHESNDDTRCEWQESPQALVRLQDEGFVRALELAFDDGAAWVRLYHRPLDQQARILFIASRTVMHCARLTNLKIVRDKSCLKLCKVMRNGKYRLWANLNFATFERMCLFYSTFVAMKRQDDTEPLDRGLMDGDELREEEHVGGRIRHDTMLHALRLLRDRSTGVIRIEASPLRGPKAGVPLWTSFVTTYKLKQDIDWAHYRGRGVVSLAALKPAPHMFVSGYVPLYDGREWLLQFDDDNGQCEQ